MTRIQQKRALRAVFAEKAAWALQQAFFAPLGGALQTVMFACYSSVTGASPMHLGFQQETARGAKGAGAEAVSSQIQALGPACVPVQYARAPPHG